MPDRARLRACAVFVVIALAAAPRMARAQDQAATAGTAPEVGAPPRTFRRSRHSGAVDSRDLFNPRTQE
jgi:hypothetical protein